jgi:hypothetical protein
VKSLWTQADLDSLPKIESRISAAFNSSSINIDESYPFRDSPSAQLILAHPVALEHAQNIEYIGDKTGSSRILFNVGSRVSVKGEMYLLGEFLCAPRTYIDIPEDSTLEVGKNVWVGAGAQIMVPPGEIMQIGEGSILGAGSVVTCSVAPMALVVGKNRKVKDINPTPQAVQYDRWVDSSWIYNSTEDPHKNLNNPEIQEGLCQDREECLHIVRKHDMEVFAPLITPKYVPHPNLEI